MFFGKVVNHSSFADAKEVLLASCLRRAAVFVDQTARAYRRRQTALPAANPDAHAH